MTTSSRQIKYSRNSKVIATFGQKPDIQNDLVIQGKLKRFEDRVGTLHDLASDIDAGYTVSALFGGGDRLNENCLGAQVIWVDFDTPRPDTRDHVLSMRPSILYYTPSHTEEKPRFRAGWVVEECLDRPTYRRAKEAFNYLFEGHGADDSTKDEARLYFGCKGSRPETFPDNVLTLEQVNEAIKEHMTALAAAKAQEATRKIEFDFTPRPAGDWKKKYLGKILESQASFVRNAVHPHRHDSLLAAAITCKGYEKGEGMDLNEARRALREAYRSHFQPGERDKECEDTINDGFDYGEGKPALHIEEKPYNPRQNYEPRSEPPSFTERLEEAYRAAGGNKTGNTATDVTDKPERPKRLYHFTELEQFPEPEWLIEGELERDSIAALVGESTVGKSFVGTDYGMRVAKNEAVIYVAGEAPSGYWKRLKAWKEYYQTEVSEKFYLWTDPVHVADPASLAAFLVEIEPLNPALIIFDTLARATLGLEENSAKDMGLAIEGLEWVRRQTKACVLVIHHTTKAGGTERGSGAIKGAMTTQLKMTVEGDIRKITVEKQKNAAAAVPRYIELKEFGGSLVVVPTTQDKTISTDKIAGRNREVLEALSSELFRETGAKWNRLLDALGWEPSPSKKTQLFRILGDLKTKGYLEHPNKGSGEPYKITPAGRDILTRQDLKLDGNKSGNKATNVTSPEGSDKVIPLHTNGKVKEKVVIAGMAGEIDDFEANR